MHFNNSCFAAVRSIINSKYTISLGKRDSLGRIMPLGMGVRRVRSPYPEDC